MTPWSAGINLAGALAVGWGLWRVAPGIAGWVLALMIAGLVAWVVRVALAAVAGRGGGSGSGADSGSDRPAWRAVGGALLCVMAIAGGVTAIPTQGLGVALLVIAVLVFGSDPAVSPLVWGAVVLVGVLGVVAGALLVRAGVAGSAGESMDLAGFLVVLAGVLLGVAGGFGRRAQRVLLAERERADAEAVRAQATAHRVAIARDLHDVLAHSLGGLVVQLDAVEALLDAGDFERAAAKVAAARRLAVAGLDEAREAVRTLRGAGEQPGSDAEEPVRPIDLESRIRALATGEKNARLDVTGAARAVPAALAEALTRAVQEALSNARKHAPGVEVRIALTWHPDRVECAIENAIPGSADPGIGVLAASGGGFGLRGVRERFAALGGTVQAGVVAPGSGGAGAVFRLRVEAPA